MTASTEKAKPEVFADFLVRLTENPGISIRQLAKDCGLPHMTAVQIEQRLQTRYLPVLAEAKKVSTKSLLKDLEGALPKALKRLQDDDLIEKAGYRELATGVGIMIEKRQLLMGEPTQIMSFEDRKTLNELAPALEAEIKKRALTVDVDFEELPIDVTKHSYTARKHAKEEDRGRV